MERQGKNYSLHCQFIITLFEDELVDCWLDLFRGQPYNSAKQWKVDGQRHKLNTFRRMNIVYMAAMLPCVLWIFHEVPSFPVQVWHFWAYERSCFFVK